MTDTFQLPAAFDLGATFFFALTGALAGMKRRYDLVGVFALAFVTGVGGALLRDCLFLQQGPPLVVRDAGYLVSIVAGCLAGVITGNFIERLGKLVAIFDAVGLSAYAVVGVQKSLAAGLSVPAAILVGVLNACGGGLLRDLITREEPLVFKAGQFYALAALVGAALTGVLLTQTKASVPVAALAGMSTAFLLRILTIVFNWRTSPLQPLFSEERNADTPTGGDKG